MGKPEGQSVFVKMPVEKKVCIRMIEKKMQNLIFQVV